MDKPLSYWTHEEAKEFLVREGITDFARLVDLILVLGADEKVDECDLEDAIREVLDIHGH